MIFLPTHHFRLALIRPQIAPNTGNIARLCVAAGADLHLVRPMGFVLDDQKLKRSGMDYWPRVRLSLHDDESAFWKVVGNDRFWLFTTKAQRGLWEADFAAGDWLVFGSETEGLSNGLLTQCPDHCVRIPQAEGERCLNLSTAAGVGLYEALRQVSGQPRF